MHCTISLIKCFQNATHRIQVGHVGPYHKFGLPLVLASVPVDTVTAAVVVVVVVDVVVVVVVGMVRHVLLVVAPLAVHVPAHGGRHARAQAVVVATAGPISSGRRLERGRCTVDDTLATHDLFLVEVGPEAVGRLDAEGAKIVLIVF